LTNSQYLAHFETQKVIVWAMIW